MGKPIRQARNEIARGARAHRLEPRARRRRSSRRARSPRRRRALRRAHHVRTGRCGRARERLELPVLRRPQLDRARAAHRQRGALQAVGARDAHRPAPRRPRCTERACRSTSCRRSSAAAAIGAALVDADVDMVCFTGSYATGRRVARAAAERLVRVQLELGGKDGAYVCDDVDVESAALAVAEGAFYNGGQSCSRDRARLRARRDLRRVRRRVRRGGRCVPRRRSRPTTRTDLGPLDPGRAARRSRRADRRRGAAWRARWCAAASVSTGRATGSSRPCWSTSTAAMTRDARRDLRAGDRRATCPRRRGSRRVPGRHRVRPRRSGVQLRPRARRAHSRRPRHRQRVLEHVRPLERAPAVGRAPPLGLRRLARESGVRQFVREKAWHESAR